jgi:TPR repeat protein
MQSAEELFYEAVQLHLRAGRAVSEAKADLWRQCFDMLRRVLEVDPHHHAIAMYNLGIYFYKGEGVEGDAVQAVHWYRKAAEQGDASAQCNLGYMYQCGEGVEKDAVQAVHWYRKAAVQGSKDAQTTQPQFHVQDRRGCGGGCSAGGALIGVGRQQSRGMH